MRVLGCLYGICDDLFGGVRRGIGINGEDGSLTAG